MFTLDLNFGKSKYRFECLLNIKQHIIPREVSRRRRVQPCCGSPVVVVPCPPHPHQLAALFQRLTSLKKKEFGAAAPKRVIHLSECDVSHRPEKAGEMERIFLECTLHFPFIEKSITQTRDSLVNLHNQGKGRGKPKLKKFGHQRGVISSATRRRWSVVVVVNKRVGFVEPRCCKSPQGLPLDEIRN